MNKILTDDEIFKLQYELQYREGGFHPIPFARAIEQAILNKLSEQEPLGWQGHSGHLVYDKKSLLPSTRHLAKPLYLHPAPSVSEGYQLVPIEPTEAMQEAWDGESSLMGTWNAMLAAARGE